MMDEIITNGGSGGAVAGIIALAHKWLSDRKMENMSSRIGDVELFSARNYVTQEAMQNVLAPIMAQLTRMEEKIDHLSEGKVDKT